MAGATDKALFANQLRAFAVLSVMFVHWCGIYWLARETVGTAVFAPPIEGLGSRLIFWLTPPTVNYGPLGVAVFFLISGFVIPFSLNRLNAKAFLVSRIFRIFPTYIVASMLSLLVVWLSSRYWGLPFTLPLDVILANFALVHSNFGYPTIDLVNWSLVIELKFYVVSAVLYAAIRKGHLATFIFFGLVVLLLCEWIPAGTPNLDFHGLTIVVEAIKREFMIVIYMFVGTCFYHHYVGNIGVRKLLLAIASLLIIWGICWSHTELLGEMPLVPLNYVYGLLIFALAYSFRRYFRPIAPLDFLANISYPLYIVHSLMGYSIMRIAMDKGVPYLGSLVLAFVVVVGVAYGLHITVERSSMLAGKRLGRWLAGDNPVAAAEAAAPVKRT